MSRSQLSPLIIILCALGRDAAHKCFKVKTLIANDLHRWLRLNYKSSLLAVAWKALPQLLSKVSSPPSPLTRELIRWS